MLVRTKAVTFSVLGFQCGVECPPSYDMFQPPAEETGRDLFHRFQDCLNSPESAVVTHSALPRYPDKDDR
jgi:hypothetical protein